jgi:transglutaminase-like putative cysteine protease
MGDEATSPIYLGRSALIDHEAPEVRAILDASLDRTVKRSPRDVAEILRRATNSALPNKNLATGFASAAEAARLRGGDCSEHAVLLAALARGAGIPARIASGLIYADRFAGQSNVWVWHVWTQCLVPTADGTGLEWLDYDATLPTRFHAAHVCVAVGAVEGGGADPIWTSVVRLVGNLDILDLKPDERAPAPTPERANEGATPR